MSHRLYKIHLCAQVLGLVTGENQQRNNCASGIEHQRSNCAVLNSKIDAYTLIMPIAQWHNNCGLFIDMRISNTLELAA